MTDRLTTHRAGSSILPGATVGILGSGQLGRMFACAAARMGYRVHVYSPEADAPAYEVAWRHTVGSYDDSDRIAEFAHSVDVVTVEFENIPAAALATAARYVPVRPGARVLQTVQDRLREKSFLRDAGIPCAKFFDVTSRNQLSAAIGTRQMLPAILKTAAWGYDGKGQTLVRTSQDAEQAWDGLRGVRAVLEELIDFHCEFSMLAARSPQGEEAYLGPIHNEHADHILDVSTLPHGALADPAIAEGARAICQRILRELEVEGLICVEFFHTPHGIKVNEIAPRPHNSGHLTIEACACSQFEQQVRAVCGLPLGSFEPTVPAAAMANLLGDVWAGGEPKWQAVLDDPRIRLHLYGKREPRPGRKMGHLTAIADSAQAAAELVRGGRQSLL